MDGAFVSDHADVYLHARGESDPAWFNMSDEDSGALFLLFSLLYLFFADIGFNWRELTQRKA